MQLKNLLAISAIAIISLTANLAFAQSIPNNKVEDVMSQKYASVKLTNGNRIAIMAEHCGGLEFPGSTSGEAKEYLNSLKDQNIIGQAYDGYLYVTDKILSDTEKDDLNGFMCNLATFNYSRSSFYNIHANREGTTREAVGEKIGEGMISRKAKTGHSVYTKEDGWIIKK